MIWTHRGGNSWSASSGQNAIGAVYEISGQLRWWLSFSNEFGTATTVKEGKRRLTDAWEKWLATTGLKEASR